MRGARRTSSARMSCCPRCTSSSCCFDAFSSPDTNDRYTRPRRAFSAGRPDMRAPSPALLVGGREAVRAVCCLPFAVYAISSPHTHNPPTGFASLHVYAVDAVYALHGCSEAERSTGPARSIPTAASQTIPGPGKPGDSVASRAERQQTLLLVLGSYSGQVDDLTGK